MKVNIGDKEYELGALTIREWKALKVKGITRESLANELKDESIDSLDKQEKMLQVVAVAFKRDHGDVDVDTLYDMDDAQLNAAFSACMGVDVDRPTSTPSTSSDAPTDGGPVSLSA